MKKYSQGVVSAVLLSTAIVVSNVAWAEELIWGHSNPSSITLFNAPITTQLGLRSSTNVAFGAEPALLEDSFPRAYLETAPTGADYLEAEVTASQDTPNSVTLRSYANVSWTEIPMFGSWANANAFLSTSFRLNSSHGNGGTVEKTITVTLEGDYESFSIELNDDVTPPIVLMEGVNHLTLNVDDSYTVHARLYSLADSVNYGDGSLPSSGSNTAAATMTMTINDVALACDLKVIPTHNQGMLTIDYEYSTSVDAVLYSWGTVGNRHEVLVDEDIVAGDSSTLNFSVGVEGLGVIGVGATLSAPGQGVICSDWKTVDTGQL